MDKRLENLVNFDSNFSNIVSSFKEYLEDTTISIEERWDSFKKYGHHLQESSSALMCYGPIDLCSMYDPPDRYRTYTHDEDIEHLEEILILEEDLEPIYKRAFLWCTRDLENIGIIFNKDMSSNDWNNQITLFLNDLKEEILSSGYYSYCYDW